MKESLPREDWKDSCHGTNTERFDAESKSFPEAD